MRVLAVTSIKGGVGKTTSAVNLAHEAARAGARVLVWDLDPQGAATFFFRVEPKVKGGSERLVGGKGELGSHVRATDVPGVHLVPADFSLRLLDLHLDATKAPTRRLADLLAPVADRYDVAVLDCAPGASLTSEGIAAAADVLLVPVVPTTLSSRTLGQLRSFLDDVDAGDGDAPAVLPFLTMVDGRKVLHRELAGQLRDEWPELLATTVPNASAVERMGIERRPVAAIAPRSPATAAYRALWAEVAARLWD